MERMTLFPSKEKTASGASKSSLTGTLDKVQPYGLNDADGMGHGLVQVVALALLF